MQAPARPLRHHLERLIIWCMLPLVVALLVAAGVLMFLAHDQQQALAQRRVAAMAAEVDANLGRHVQGLKTLAATSVSPTPRQTLAELHAKAVAYEQAVGFPVLLTDADRRIWLSSARPVGEPLPSLPKPKGPSALDAALQSGQAQVGNIVPGPILNRPVIPIIVPVHELPGDKAWLTSLPTDLWQRRLDGEQITAGWNVVLLDANGQLIAGRGPDVQHTAPASTGGKRFSFSANTQRAPWTAVAYATPWTFYQPQLRLALVLITVLAAVALMAMWLVRRSTRQINQAVHQLTERIDAPRVGSVPLDATWRIAEIEAVQQELRRLRQAEQAAEFQERQRVARELHDGLQQNIASVKLLVDVARQPNDRTRDVAETLQQASQGAQQALVELHHVVNDLRPPALDQLGLMEALERHAQSFSRLTGLQIEIETVGDAERLKALSTVIQAGLYRIAQECLNNVRKHAQASFVHIIIDCSEPNRLALQVSDDGVGLNPNRPVRHDAFGLSSMRQRIEALGGRLEIRHGHGDDPDGGTTVRGTIPCC